MARRENSRTFQKRTAEKSALTLIDRPPRSARVITINRSAHTMVLEVLPDLKDNTGAPIYLNDVPYDPQTPFNNNDIVKIQYDGHSPHSARVIGGSLGVANAQSTINVVGASIELKEVSGVVDFTGVKTIVFPLGSLSGTSPTITVTPVDPNAIYKDGSRVWTANQSVGGFKLTNLADPTVAQDAATKNYVDAVLNGFDFKGSVRAKTTANINLSAPGATIDGVTMVAGDLFLAGSQTTGSQNGTYVWNGSAVAATRAPNADTSAEVNAGMFVIVEEGTTYADTGWLLTTNNPITLGTTSLTFTQFPGAGGSGITQLTGDVTAGPGSGSQAATIAANAVTNAKLAQMAAHTYKGNNTGSTANPADITNTQLTADLNVFVASGGGHLKGLVPDPGASAGTAKFLREDATFAVPPGIGFTALYARMRGYSKSGAAALTDSTYFDPFNIAGNTGSNIVNYFYKDLQYNGAFQWNPSSDWYFWARFSVQNPTGAGIVVHPWLIAHDDSMVFLIEELTNLTGTVGTGIGVVTGTGTNFVADGWVAGDYISVAGGDLLRITGGITATNMNIANTPPNLIISGATYAKAKKIYLSGPGAAAPANGSNATYYNYTIAAGKTVVFHVLGNSNGAPNFWDLQFGGDGLRTSGLVFVDPGA